jgi:hypothetical protein
VIGADPHNANRMFEQFAEVADCGADTVVFTGHLRGEAWYPSELAKYSETLVVDDAVAEGARRARELGMRAAVYVGAPLVQQALRDQTDWRQRGPQGEVRGEDPACCLLSPFGDWIIDYLCEMAKHAPIDGIWLDGYPQAPLACACPHCADRYLADTGAGLPQTGDPKSPELRRYVVWWHRQCEEHARKLTARLHQASPNCALFANCATGRSPDAWRHGSDNLCALLDSPSVEQFWHVDRPGDPLNPAFAIAMLNAAAGGKPTEVFVPLLPHTVDCTTALPRVEMLARNLTVLANGAAPQSTYGPGRQDLFKELLDEIRRREPYLTSARRARYCGVAASTLTALQYGRDQPEKEYWEEVRGWLRALTEAHLPVELLCDRQLTEGDFTGLRVIVLPSTACLSPAAAQRLAQFVDEGGGLVATCAASLADDMGEPQADFALAELLGAHFRALERHEPLPAFSILTPETHPLARGPWVDDALWQQWICLGHRPGAVGLPGKCVTFDAQGDRQTAWRYAGGTPAVITGTVSAGRVAYIGPEVGAAYHRNGYPYLRSLMESAVLWAAGQPPLDRVQAPLIVQATYFGQSADTGAPRRIIHLLNEVSSQGRASLPAGAMPLREEVVPVAGVKARLSPPVSEVRLEPEGTRLEARPLAEGGFEVEVPPLGLHSMVVVEP